MPIVASGAVGLGLVWGWVMSTQIPPVQTLSSVRAIIRVAAFLMLTATVLWLTNWTVLLFFLASCAGSTLLHVILRRILFMRSGSPTL